MASTTEMLKYFSKPGFNRLFQAIRRKYRSLGRIGGKVQLRNLTPLEQETLGGFFGRNLVRQSGLTIDVAEVDKIIRDSRFTVSLQELLEIYFSEELKSNQDMVREKEEEWEQFFDRLEPLAIREKTSQWLQKLKAGKEPGYRILLSLYNENRQEADRVLNKCISALDKLPAFTGDQCRRPVFAAKLTGNPHGLDRGTWLGRLLYAGMLCVLETRDEDPNSQADETQTGNRYRAEMTRAIFRRAGLEEDDLSSNVIVAGLRTIASDTRAGLFDNAWETATPLILPLRFFECSTKWLPFESVYVVENPTLLSAVLDAWKTSGCPPMICPSGQPSVAALKLLDELTAEGTKIYYSGDFDGKGLEIGIGLWQRYKAAFVPWKFDSLTYNNAPAGTELTGDQKRRIASLEVPWDRSLPEVILKRGYVVYQEALVEDIIRNLQEKFIKKFRG